MKKISPLCLPLLAIFIHVVCSSGWGCSINNSTDFSANDSNLVMVQAIFRHGDRNPFDHYRGDPWIGSKYWPEGPGQLTNIGKQQSYELGKWLRNRYEKQLFPNGFSSQKVQIFSTETARTMMSASTCAAGLFPPTNNQIWNKNLLWQPIPVYTIAADVDTMLLPSKPCPLHMKLHQEFKESKIVQRKLKKFEKTLDVLKEHCGTNAADLNGASIIFDTLQIEVFRNRTIPFWAKKIYSSLGKITQFSEFSFGATPQMARLNGGFLIKKILDNFSEKAKFVSFEGRNVILFSAHDATIVAALTTLGLYEMDLPAYASCLMFELHEAGGEHFIKIFYKKTPTDFNVQPVYIPNCGYACSLKKISKLYEAVIPTKSYDDECQFHG